MVKNLVVTMVISTAPAEETLPIEVIYRLPQNVYLTERGILMLPMIVQAVEVVLAQFFRFIHLLPVVARSKHVGI